MHHCQTHPRITQQIATKVAKNKPIGHDRKLRQPQAAKNQIFFEKIIFPQISIGLFRDSGVWYCRGVWKGILFTAAKIKATHGKGADFYRQHLANNDYYSEHDRVEGHWRGILRPYQECIRLGYDIEMKRSDKGEITGFEIKGVSEDVLKRCLRRREQIDKEIEKFVSTKGRQPTPDEVKLMTLLARGRKLLEISIKSG